MGVHIEKHVAIRTRSANQNPESRRICRGVPIEARPYEYSISFPGYRTCAASVPFVSRKLKYTKQNSAIKKDLYLSGMKGRFMVCFNVSAWSDI